MAIAETMPLGVTGVMLPELDLDEQIALCVGLGITHYVARPRIIAQPQRDKPYSSHGNHKLDLTPQRLADEGAAIGRRLRDAGLVTFCTVPQGSADAPDAEHTLNFRGAEAAGFSRVKITPISYPKGLFDYKAYVGAAVARYRELCGLAKPLGLKLIVEMHANNGASSPGLARYILEHFEPDELGVIIDLPNYAREGYVEANLALSAVRDWIDHVHLGGLRRVKGAYDADGFVKTGGMMCSLTESDLYIPEWLGLLHGLGVEVPLIIEDYSSGMTGAAKVRRTVREVTPVLEALARGSA